MARGKKHLSVFLLAMMNVAIIMSLRGLPLMAEEGLSLVFYLLFSLLIFFIPSALVSAELATAWPESGGVFQWVSLAFGQRAGFTAIWLQWLQNVFWYPTVLGFAAGTLAQIFYAPDLVDNKLYNVAVILIIYWGATLLSFKGMKASGWFSSLGALLGTILPGVMIIFLGLFWWLDGKPLLIHFEDSWIPKLGDFSNLALLGGILLLFAGIEVNAVHAQEVDNPRRSYPKAIFLSVVLIFVIFFLGALSIAAVVPKREISFTAGVMQALAVFLDYYQLRWLVPFFGSLIVLGTIAGIAAWIVGPSKGLLATAKKGVLPPVLSRTNSQGVPINILLIQGVVVTILSFLYLIMPTINSAFFLLTDLTVILYLIMYLFMFSAAIVLRYKKPKQPRTYKIPFGNFGMWFVSLVGIMGALFAIFIGFFPPTQLKLGSPTFYVLFLSIGTFLALVIPQCIESFKKPKWKKKR